MPRDLSRKVFYHRTGYDNLIPHAHIDRAPSIVLNTIVDRGTVAETADCRRRLLAHAFLPTSGTDRQVAAHQARLCAQLEEATQNLIARVGHTPNLDRALRTSHLSNTSIVKLEALASTKAQNVPQESDAAERLQDGQHDAGAKTDLSWSTLFCCLRTRQKG